MLTLQMPFRHSPMHIDPFQHDQPFNISSQTGAAAFLAVSRPLDVAWDRTAEMFPFYIHAIKAHWNAAALHSVLEVNGNNILTNYSSITKVQIATASANCIK